MPPLDPVIQALKNRINELEDEVAILQERLKVQPERDYTYGAFFRLTPSEETLFQVLVQKPFCSHLYLFESLYSNKPHDAPDPSVIPVFICKLQSKLRKHNIYIQKRWGQGYYLTMEAKDQIIRMVNPLRRLIHAELPDSTPGRNS